MRDEAARFFPHVFSVQLELLSFLSYPVLNNKISGMPTSPGLLHTILTFDRSSSLPSKVPLIFASHPCMVDGGGLHLEPSERNYI